MVAYVYTMCYSMHMKNKRMIYIYDENLTKYNSIENKSEWINEKIKELEDVPLEVDDRQTRIDDFEEKMRKLRGEYGRSGTL